MKGKDLLNSNSKVNSFLCYITNGIGNRLNTDSFF